MIRNFHFKMLIGLSVFAFLMSFIYLSAAWTDRIGAPVDGLFATLGLFAAITAGAIRSIHQRLDRAGIAEDPQHPASEVPATHVRL